MVSHQMAFAPVSQVFCLFVCVCLFCLFPPDRVLGNTYLSLIYTKLPLF